jgi:transcriptional regulator with XRE-family HTH domain
METKVDLEKDIYYLVGQNIKKQRKLKGLTQKKLSEMTFYSYEFVRKIESKSACRNTFSLDTVDKIAKALGVNIKVLFDPLDEDKVS